MQFIDAFYRCNFIDANFIDAIYRCNFIDVNFIDCRDIELWKPTMCETRRMKTEFKR